MRAPVLFPAWRCGGVSKVGRSKMEDGRWEGVAVRHYRGAWGEEPRSQGRKEFEGRPSGLFWLLYFTVARA